MSTSTKSLSMKDKVLANIPKEETIASYTCCSCQSVKEGKPWITVDFPGNLYHACSYSCNRKMDDVLPKGYYDLIVNKEDFNEPMPVIRTKPKYEPFNFLTDTEIKHMSTEEYAKYEENVDEQCLLNPTRSNVYYEQLENEEHERLIENESSDSSEDVVCDDY
mgnify:CR=1 FL=1